MADSEVNEAPSAFASTRRPLISESTRLQREVERFTGKLETERRLSLLLDEDIRSAKQTFTARQLALKATYKQQKTNTRDQDRLHELETLLDLAKCHTNDLVTSNARLRDRVDSLRKGNLDTVTYARTVNQEIESLHSSVERVHTDSSKARRTDSVFQTRIYRLQDQYDSDRVNASLRVDSLEHEIREDRKRKKEIMRRLNLSIAQTHTELSESGQVAQHLHTKWLQKTRDKRREFGQYVGFIDDLRRGLGQMKDISGQDDYTQVVKTLLNAMERQREIQNHLIKLTEQIENIKGELKKSQSYISSDRQKEERVRGDKEERLNKANSQLRSVESSMEKGKETLKEVKEAISTLAEPVKLLKEMCIEVGVTPEITPGGLSNSDEFTLDTAGLHLLALEEALFKLAALLRVSRASTSEDSGMFFLTEKRFDRSINIASLLKDESLLTGEEENHALNPSEFRQRAERALGPNLPI